MIMPIRDLHSLKSTGRRMRLRGSVLDVVVVSQ